jgi:hypothetical protein
MTDTTPKLLESPQPNHHQRRKEEKKENQRGIVEVEVESPPSSDHAEHIQGGDIAPWRRRRPSSLT